MARRGKVKGAEIAQMIQLIVLVLKWSHTILPYCSLFCLFVYAYYADIVRWFLARSRGDEHTRKCEVIALSAQRNTDMLAAVVGLAAFYGGHPLLSSPPRSRACVAHHMGDVPHDDEPVVKTSQGIDVEAAAAEISRLLKEQEAADAAAAAEMGDIADKDAVTSELEAALEATVKAAEEETGAAAMEAAKAKKLWIEQEEALQAAKAKQLRIEQEEALQAAKAEQAAKARALEVERIKQEEAAALEAKRLAAAKAAVCVAT